MLKNYIDKLIINKHQIEYIKYRQQLSPLLENWTYLPWTDSAPGAEFFCHLLNDICIHNRKHIFEFGTGISTIILSRLAKINDLDITISTVDQDLSWIDIVKNITMKDGTHKYINFIHSPLITTPQNGQWYTEDAIKIEAKIDTVIVDGPVTSPLGQRYPAGPFVQPHLNSKFSIFVHDTDRPLDRKNVLKWIDSFPPDIKINFMRRHAVLSSGDLFNVYPQKCI